MKMMEMMKMNNNEDDDDDAAGTTSPGDVRSQCKTGFKQYRGNDINLIHSGTYQC